MLQDTLRQLSSHRAACKQWSVFVSVAVLVFGALGRLSTANLLWMAAPLVLLGFAEAGYAARETYGEQLLKNGKNNEQLVVLPKESALATSRRTAVSLCSLSVWPFYLALWGVIAASAYNLPRTATSMPALTGATAAHATQPGIPGGPTNYAPSGYPQAMMQRPPNGMPNAGPYMGYPGTAPRTPGPAFPRPVGPTNFNSAPPNRATYGTTSQHLPAQSPVGPPSPQAAPVQSGSPPASPGK